MSQSDYLPGPRVLDGLEISEQTQMMNDIFGKDKFVTVEISPQGREALSKLDLSQGPPNLKGALTNPKDFAAVNAVLEAARKGDVSPVAMHWRPDSASSGHAVLLLGQTPDGHFIIKNPQAYGKDVVNTATGQIFRQGLDNGTSLVDYETMLKWIQGGSVPASVLK